MIDSARASSVGDIDAENWLRGRFRLACERGALDATVTLAPTNPPRVQYLMFKEGEGTGLSPESHAVRALGPGSVRSESDPTTHVPCSYNPGPCPPLSMNSSWKCTQSCGGSPTRMRRERAQSVQATELVHEAYLRLMKDKRQAWTSRAHFLAIAAISMRRLLVERARARGRQSAAALACR